MCDERSLAVLLAYSKLVVPSLSVLSQSQESGRGGGCGKTRVAPMYRSARSGYKGVDLKPIIIIVFSRAGSHPVRDAMCLS